MKRHGNLWHKISSIDNVRNAAQKSVAGKKMTKQRQRFVDNEEHYINELHRMLVNEDYKFSGLYSFTVNEPKKREIHCPKFYPDRVLHHCLMNVIAPLMLEKFTADTYGSIPKRGVASLNNKLQKLLKKHPEAYYLQVDIKKFYQSISIHVVKEKTRRVIKCNKTLRMIDAILDVHDKGVPIGAYPSQYFANLVLSTIDHWVKEVARVKNYFRYMDDMLFIVETKQEAHNILAKLTPKIHDLGLTIKNNVRIAPVKIGIDFVGYKFYPTHTRLRKKIKERMQRRVKRLTRMNVSDAYFMRKTASHFGWCVHADARNLLRTTFKDKIYLYSKRMEIKRLSDKKREEWFDLPKTKRVSIEQLFDIDIAFFDYMIKKIRGEEKVVVKFAYAEEPKQHHYFITRSDVIRDRLNNDREHMPFVASIKKIKNYTAYE